MNINTYKKDREGIYYKKIGDSSVLCNTDNNFHIIEKFMCKIEECNRLIDIQYKHIELLEEEIKVLKNRERTFKS